MGLSYQELVRENQELRIRLARLEQENQALRAKVAALEAELRRGRRQAAPFSWDEPEPLPKRPGRHPGQGQFTCRKVSPEEEIH